MQLFDSPVGGGLNRFIDGFYIKHLVDVYGPDVFLGCCFVCAIWSS